jgi:hypothetical protein
VVQRRLDGRSCGAGCAIEIGGDAMESRASDTCPPAVNGRRARLGKKGSVRSAGRSSSASSPDAVSRTVARRSPPGTAVCALQECHCRRSSSCGARMCIGRAASTITWATPRRCGRPRGRAWRVRAWLDFGVVELAAARVDGRAVGRVLAENALVLSARAGAGCARGPVVGAEAGHGRGDCLSLAP